MLLAVVFIMSRSDPCGDCGRHRADCECLSGYTSVKTPVPIINGNYINTEIYKCLEKLSNSVGETITEYHWREFCGLMKMMEDEKLITITWK